MSQDASVMFVFLLSMALAQPALSPDGFWTDCGLDRPGLEMPPPVPPRPFETPWRVDEPPVIRRESPIAHYFAGVPSGRFTNVGALSGKSVYLSAGHGFTWTNVGGTFFWRTQRPNTNDIVEDLVSTETVHQWLVPMLQNAGARVHTVRESDTNPALVLVDNADPAYVETGAPTQFSTSSLESWGRPVFPMSGDVNPFSLGTNRLMTVSSTVTASATWSATIPSDGFYEVSVAYTSFSARVTDAHFVVRHAGGETHFRINQQRHGGTWVTLGNFYFRAGGTAQVVAQNDSRDTRSLANVSLDAVKFGGGVGLVDRGGGVSTRARYEESARYQAQWAGAPAGVYAPTSNMPGDDRGNDVGVRPRFSAWVHEDGEPAVYVAFHTNAANGAARGTQTYVFGTRGVGLCSLATDYAGVPGSRELGDFLRQELINDLRQDAGWNEPTWRDYGTLCANFGELNTANNNETPAVLMEMAFHDNPTDAARLKEPQFRYLAARALAQGIIRYFASVDGTQPVFPPEPPSALSARNLMNGRVQVSWSASPLDAQGVGGQAATRYRVYSSDDGLAWDEGVETMNTALEFPLPPSRPKYFRVTGVNSGGEGFPSIVVGARAGPPRLLVINGYDRFEAAQAQLEAFPARFALNSVVRVFPRRINDGSYVRVHGDALETLGFGFDSASDDAVENGAVVPSSYEVVSWFAGRGKAGAGPPSGAALAALRGALNQRTRIIFSGESAASMSLLQDVGQAVPGVGAASRSLSGVGPLAGLSWTMDDGSGDGYDVGDGDGGSLDVLAPMGSAQALAAYVTGSAAATGVAGRSALLGFPLEGVTPRATRIELLRRLLLFTADGGTADDAGVEPDAGPGVDAGGTGVPDAGAGGGSAGGAVAGGAAAGGAAGGVEGGGAAGDAGGDAGPAPVLAFEGGGCQLAPGLALAGLAVIVHARRHRRGLH